MQPVSVTPQEIEVVQDLLIGGVPREMQPTSVARALGKGVDVTIVDGLITRLGAITPTSIAHLIVSAKSLSNGLERIQDWEDYRGA